MRTTPEIYRPALPDPTTDESVGRDRSETDSLQIRDYTRIVYRRRWIIIGIMAAGLGCGVLVNLKTVPTFEAQTTVHIDTDLNVLGLDRPLLPDHRDWMSEFLPTQLGILQSRDLASRVHDDLKLSDRSGPSEALAIPPNGSSLPPHAGERQVPTVDDILAGQRVSLIHGSRLVNIGFRHHRSSVGRPSLKRYRTGVRAAEPRVQVKNERRCV